jgi:hypothetical protein
MGRYIRQVLLLALILGPRGRAAEQEDAWRMRTDPAAGDRILATIHPGEPVKGEVPAGLTVSFAGPAADRQPGAPDLGGMVRTIPGRPGFRAVVRAVKVESRDEPEVRVAPAEGWRRIFVDDNVYRTEKFRQADPSVFSRNAFWPPAVLQLDEAWMGTNKWVRLVCRPAQYNPVRRVLRLHTRIECEIVFEPEGEKR